MLRLIDTPDAADPFFTGDEPLLDLDALDAFEPPRSLSRDEGRVTAGPDWSRTCLSPDEDADND